MNSWGEGELAWLRLRLAMNYLLDKRPEDALDAIIRATGED